MHPCCSGLLPELYSQWVVGFSGVLCAMMVVDTYCNRKTMRVLGVLDVPWMAFPFVDIVINKIIVPRSSFVAHASGTSLASTRVEQ